MDRRTKGLSSRRDRQREKRISLKEELKRGKEDKKS